jgi:hypothetical protein
LVIGGILENTFFFKQCLEVVSDVSASHAHLLSSKWYCKAFENGDCCGNAIA